MSNIPGDLAEYSRSSEIYPVLLKIAARFQGVPVGFVQTADAPAASNLIPAIPPDTLSATVQVQGGAIRYTMDGTTPTAAKGHRADPNTVLTVTTGEALRGFQWINEGATASTLAVTFWS